MQLLHSHDNRIHATAMLPPYTRLELFVALNGVRAALAATLGKGGGAFEDEVPSLCDIVRDRCWIGGIRSPRRSWRGVVCCFGVAGAVVYRLHCRGRRCKMDTKCIDLAILHLRINEKEVDGGLQVAEQSLNAIMIRLLDCVC